MKKLLVLGSLFLSSLVFAAQPSGIGNVKVKRISFEPYTLAAINALAPDTTGQVVMCADCTTSPLCISSGAVTGSSVGAFVILTATGSFVGSTFSGIPHCK